MSQQPAVVPPLHDTHQHEHNHLQNEVTKVEHNNYASNHHDLESGHGQATGQPPLMSGGAPLGRQISVQLSNEQYERLFLQTGGVGGKGDLAKRFGNPTPIGVASFLICLTTFSTELMGWAGTTTTAAAPAIGAFYFIGGLGLYLAAILEWVLGNTFPSTVFALFGGYWLAFAFLLQPSQGIAAAVGATTLDYNAGIALYLVWWGVLTLIFFIASLRTNVVFALLFFFLDITFWILVGAYLNIANANVGSLTMILKAAGAFGFLTSLCGWYLLLVIVLGSTGVPLALPVGDLSGFMSRKPKTHVA